MSILIDILAEVLDILLRRPRKRRRGNRGGRK